jgi:glycosyltransferase involved in cell wall biosynthesis
MRICQVQPGILEIKPIGKMGWGAVEKIIREYKSSFEKLGHEVDIKYLNEADPNKYDIIHIHMANLCIEAKNRGIPYIFSLHDHHTEYNGKDSFIFKQNLEAMKGSVFSITHAEHLIEYFNETDKLFYVSHGVNTDFFTPKESDHNHKHKLLMVANNGLAGNQGTDRKGFRYGIESAKELDLEITIVGAEANKEFFAIHKDLLDYKKLTIIDSNPTEDELLKIFQDHHIFLHPSFLEAGHPNLTLLEACSCCLPIVGTYKGSKEIVGMYVMKELTTNELTKGINDVINQYDILTPFMSEVRLKYDWINVCKELAKMYANVTEFQNAISSDETRNKYIQLHNKNL